MRTTMATKNPKVTSYLSPEVYDSLVGYQKSNRIASLSGAITAILAEYLQGEDSSASTNGVASDLSVQVDSLAREFAEIRKRIASLESSAGAGSSEDEPEGPAVGAKAAAVSNGKSASQSKSAKAKPVASKAKSAKAKPIASKAKPSKASKPVASKAKPSRASRPTASKAKPSRASKPVASKAKSAKAKIPAGALEGMTQGQLCQQFGINTKNVSKKARAQGVSSQDYMESVTGWVYRDGKYFPPV